MSSVRLGHPASLSSNESLVLTQVLNHLTLLESAIVISLAHLSGWSAEQVAHCISKLAYSAISAEDVWGFYWEWVLNHEPGSQELISQAEVEVMRYLLGEVGIYIEVGQEGKPLTRTIQPLPVAFIEIWYPEDWNLDYTLLCFDYDRFTRERSISFLLEDPDPRSLGYLTDVERPIVAAFGSTAEHLIKSVLMLWSCKMRKDMERTPLFRRFNERDLIAVMKGFLATFTDRWEELFGSIENPVEHELRLDPTEDIVHITSTGYGMQVLTALLMADRVQVMEAKRRTLSAGIGFEFLAVKSLEKDCRSCSICQDELGLANPEGITEKPVQMTICCGQVFGNVCLKAWVGEAIDAKPAKVPTCPMCRFKLPESFSTKLLDSIDGTHDSPPGFPGLEVGGDKIQQSIGDEDEEAHSPIPVALQRTASPSPESAYATAEAMSNLAGLVAQQRRRRHPSPSVTVDPPERREQFEEHMVHIWGLDAQRRRTHSPRRLDVQTQTISRINFLSQHDDNFVADRSFHRGNVGRQDEFAREG